jgi:hypothetical protein
LWAIKSLKLALAPILHATDAHAGFFSNHAIRNAASFSAAFLRNEFRESGFGSHKLLLSYLKNILKG